METFRKFKKQKKKWGKPGAAAETKCSVVQTRQRIVIFTPLTEFNRKIV